MVELLRLKKNQSTTIVFGAATVILPKSTGSIKVYETIYATPLELTTDANGERFSQTDNCNWIWEPKSNFDQSNLENNNFPAKIIGQRSISASSADMTGVSTITCVDGAAGISQTDQLLCNSRILRMVLIF